MSAENVVWTASDRRRYTPRRASVASPSGAALVALMMLMSAVSVSGRTITEGSLGPVAVVDGDGDASSENDATWRITNCAPIPYDTLWLKLNLERTPNDAVLPGARTTTAASASGAAGRDSRRQQRQQQRHRRRQRRRASWAVDTDPTAAVAAVAVDDDPSRSRFQSNGNRPRRPKNRNKHNDRMPKPRRSKSDVDEAISTGEAWQCHMETTWERLPAGSFPPYVLTGRCRQTTCMLGLYECRPKKYAVRVLRRLDGRCNPLPRTDSDATTYEDAWVAVDHHVVVGCDCSKRRVSGYG